MRRFATATFAALAVRNYRLYFAGQAVSVLGNWIQRLGLVWLILELTDSGTWLGIAIAVQQLPILLLAPWTGTLADRYSKRSILLCVNLAAIVPATTLGILTLTGHVNVVGVLVFAALFGLADSVEKPTRQAFPSEMVPLPLVSNAVTLNNVLQSSGQAVGPVVGAFLIAGVGLPWTFLVNAATFAAVCAGLLLMRPADLLRPVPVQRASGQFREALRYVGRTPGLLVPLLLVGAAGLLAYNFQVTLPLLGRETFGGDAQDVGLIMAAFGIGAVLGGLSVAGVLQATPRRVVLAAGAFALGFAVTGAAPTFEAALVTVFALGVFHVVFETMSTGSLQLFADPQMRGRVLSMWVLAVSNPIGAPIIGWLSGQIGTRAAFMVVAGGMGAAAVAAHVYLRSVSTGASRPIGPVVATSAASVAAD